MTLSFFIRLKFGWAHALCLNIYKMTHQKKKNIYKMKKKTYLFFFFKTNTLVCMYVCLYIYINAFEMLEVNMLIINRIKKNQENKKIKKKKKKEEEGRSMYV